MAAYVVGSHDRVAAEDALIALKRRLGRNPADEIKRRDLREEEYFRFLEDLSAQGGFVVSVATDAGMNEKAAESQSGQVRIIREAIDGLKTSKDKLEAEALAAAMEALSSQLYVEIICRMHLAWLAVNIGVAHYVQVEPQTLWQMAWYFDEKGGAGTAFESAHGPLMAGLAGEMSRNNPMPFVAGADYSSFGRFIRGGAATLQPPTSGQARADVMVNAKRVYREHQRFVKSSCSLGVQIADLLVSGIAALLRGKFLDQERDARCLGRLTMRLYATDHAIYALGFGAPSTANSITAIAASAINGMNAQARAVFHQRSR